MGENNPNVHRWMSTLWHICTTECYPAIKRNKELIHANTWRNLDNIMLCAKSPTKKVTYCVISFIWCIQNRQIHRDGKQISGSQGMGEGEMGSSYLMADCFSLCFWVDEKVWKTRQSTIKATEPCTWKWLSVNFTSIFGKKKKRRRPPLGDYT